MMKFPQDFLWGTATSAYQVEGNNDHSDWWAWEKKAGKQESALACNHYELYEKDFDIAKELHHNAHRFSIEWARIEPREGHFSSKELDHYKDVILALRRRGIEPLVTLHHFTNPAWLSKSGGWVAHRTVERFLRYCDYVVRALAPHVQYWMTINEPNVYLSHAYLFGVWPPQEKSNLKAVLVGENMSCAHIKAYQAIHKIYKQLNLAKPSVGIAQNVMAFVPCPKTPKNRFAAYLRNKVYNRSIFDRIKGLGIGGPRMDFIGVNFYSRQLVGLKRFNLGSLAWDTTPQEKAPFAKKNSLGWDIYPQGLYDVLMELKSYKLPLIITENGICTDDDNLRWEYIHDHLSAIHKAIKKGAPVKGYLYWSLLDNFEWDKGFAPRFGLVNVNYENQERSIRPSARLYAEICKTGTLK